MRREKSHPAWWQLYLLVLGAIGLLALGALAHLSGPGHQVAAIGTLLLVWGLVEIWLRANAWALLRGDGQVLGQEARPKPLLDMSDDEWQPVLIHRRQPEDEAGEQPAAGASCGSQEGDG